MRKRRQARLLQQKMRRKQPVRADNSETDDELMEELLKRAEDDARDDSDKE